MPLVYTGEICQYNLHDDALVCVFIRIFTWVWVNLLHEVLFAL